MTAISEDVINEIITEISVLCNIRDWRYSHQKLETIAQNYFGVIIPIILTGKENGQDVSIKLVLKLTPTDARYHISGAVTLMFAREIFFYSVILKKYQEIQQVLSPISQYVIPNCYYICKEYCKEAIAMKNMCDEGYKPFTTEMFLDFDHITNALKSLAKLHALSFILKEKDLKLYEEATEVCFPLREKTNKRYFDIMVDRLSKALQKFRDTDYVPLLETLRHNCAKYFDVTVDAVQGTCICHGDIWKENILFKYKYDVPVSACIIDYQTTRICSPAFDTLYFIISSTNAVLRKKYYYQLLDIYYKTFDQMLCEASLESHKLYSRMMFEHDLKVVWPACLITANTALWLASGLQEEGHVRSKHVWSTQEEKEKASNQFKTIIKSVIDDFISYGYLDLKSKQFEIGNYSC